MAEGKFRVHAAAKMMSQRFWVGYTELYRDYEVRTLAVIQSPRQREGRGLGT